MTIERARKIMSACLSRKGAADRLGGLLKERAHLDRLGNDVLARQVDRTIEDLCGHYDDGEFIGAATIARASEMCRAYPVGS